MGGGRRGRIALLLALSLTPVLAPAAEPPPRLVLLVVVDQLRGGSLETARDRLGPDGLGRLMDGGLAYRSACHRFGVTATAPAHATLATGALPAVHGIVGNEWLDPETGERRNAAGGAGAGDGGGHDDAGAGRSPAWLEAETLADVLADATAGKAGIFAVAGKDRSAIMLAGRGGKAFWYDHQAGRYVTGGYYYPSPPAWLEAWNESALDGLDAHVWRLSAPESGYRLAGRDDQPWERDYKGLGRVFPHRLAASTDPDAALRAMPVADALTVDLAVTLLREAGLGRDAVPDLLMVGLSATDYIGHAFGPDSLEAEDNLLWLDRTIATLLAAARAAAGEDGVLTVLTSDHGIPSAPEYIRSRGGESGRIDVPGIMDGLNAFLGERFDTRRRLARAFLNPWIYLDMDALETLGLDPAAVESAAAGWLSGVDGLVAVFTRSGLLDNARPGEALLRRVRAGFHPARSGHLYLVQAPGWHLYSDPDYHAAMHGSPWDYDTHVPLVFMGPGIPAGHVDRAVGSEDLAPTLAALLGIRTPAQATGSALEEIVGDPPGPL